MSGVLKEKKGMYYAYFYDSALGKPIWRATGIKAERGNKRKAEQKKQEIIEKYFNNPREEPMFIDYIEQWLTNTKGRVDTITYEGYEEYARGHIIPYFEPLKLKLQDVKMSDIERYYNYKSVSGRLDGKEGGLSYRTIKLHSIVLNLVFEYAMRNKLIQDNPCKYAEIPKTAKRSEKIVNFYTPEQCRELLSLTEGTTLYDMIYLTFIYGLRRSELMGLKWDAVDFVNNTITIQHTVVLHSTMVAKDKIKNESSNRTYPLLNDVREILLKRKSQQEECNKLFGNCYCASGYVFAREDGKPFYPSYPTHAMKKVLERNNLPHIRWHDLRHSTASMLIEKGWSMKDISEWLGHADIGTTMNIYGHISMEHKRKLGDSLEGTL